MLDKRLMVLGSISKVIHNTDYLISTWMLLGACFQTILVALLPRRVALLPPIIFLTYRFVRGYLIAKGHLKNPIQELQLPGRFTTQIPRQDGTFDPKPSSESIVVLIISAHWIHPNGRFSPGGSEIGEIADGMWKEAVDEREKYGYLGQTPSMVPELNGKEPGRVDDKGKTIMWVSYWKNIDGLHAYARGPAHMKGWRWWETKALKQYKHIGISHELYEVPAGNWENITHRHNRFGLGNTIFPVRGEPGVGEEKGATKWMSGLMGAEAYQWRNMERRMGRPPGSIGLKKGAKASDAADDIYATESKNEVRERSPASV